MDIDIDIPYLKFPGAPRFKLSNVPHYRSLKKGMCIKLIKKITKKNTRAKIDTK